MSSALTAFCSSVITRLITSYFLKTAQTGPKNQVSRYCPLACGFNDLSALKKKKKTAHQRLHLSGRVSGLKVP